MTLCVVPAPLSSEVPDVLRETTGPVPAPFPAGKWFAGVNRPTSWSCCPHLPRESFSVLDPPNAWRQHTRSHAYTCVHGPSKGVCTTDEVEDAMRGWNVQ
eukprot:1195323-Prorocentrum_minimum.AAC.12